MSDSTLFDRMRGIEARHLGVDPSADRAARKVAIDRRREQLTALRAREPDDVFSVSLPDPCLRALFVSLCRRYGMRPHRHARQRRETVLVSAPSSFYERTFWPEFQGLSDALAEHFDALTVRLLVEVLDDDTARATGAARDDEAAP